MIRLLSNVVKPTILYTTVSMSSLLIEWFALDHQAGASNLIWRWLTAHFVHFGVMHWLLNMVGLVVIASLNRAFLFSKQGITCFALLCLWVSAGVWWLNPEIIRYAGLSGVLHGLFVLSVIKAAGFSVFMKVALIALWSTKVLLEQLEVLDLSTTATLLGVGVAKDAHLYGLICGFFIITCCFMSNIIDKRQ